MDENKRVTFDFPLFFRIDLKKHIVYSIIARPQVFLVINRVFRITNISSEKKKKSSPPLEKNTRLFFFSTLVIVKITVIPIEIIFSLHAHACKRVLNCGAKIHLSCARIWFSQLRCEMNKEANPNNVYTYYSNKIS